MTKDLNPELLPCLIDAIDLADHLIQCAYGVDKPDEWDAAIMKVSNLRSTPQPLSGQTAPVMYTDGEMSREIEERQPDVMGAVDCIKAFINCSDRNGNHDSDVDKRVRASIDTIEAALRSPGMVMVPVEPTEEMIYAAINRKVPEDDLYSGVYRAMIAARVKND